MVVRIELQLIDGCSLKSVSIWVAMTPQLWIECQCEKWFKKKLLLKLLSSIYRWIMNTNLNGNLIGLYDFIVDPFELKFSQLMEKLYMAKNQSHKVIYMQYPNPHIEDNFIMQSDWNIFWHTQQFDISYRKGGDRSLHWKRVPYIIKMFYAVQ